MKVSTFIANLDLNRIFYEQCKIGWLRKEAKYRGIKITYQNKLTIILLLLMYDNTLKIPETSKVLRVYLDFYNKNPDGSPQWTILAMEPKYKFWRNIVYDHLKRCVNLDDLANFIRQWRNEKKRLDKILQCNKN